MLKILNQLPENSGTKLIKQAIGVALEKGDIPPSLAVRQANTTNNVGLRRRIGGNADMIEVNRAALYTARKSQSLTQAALARATKLADAETGITKGFVCQLEKGNAPRASRGVIETLAGVLGTTVDYLSLPKSQVVFQGKKP